MNKAFLNKAFWSTSRQTLILHKKVWRLSPVWCNLHKCYENENSLIHCIESVALVNITLIQMIQDFLFAYVMMIIHRLSDVSSCSEAMNQLRLEPKLKSLSQSTATGSNDCGHTKMQWIILVVSPIKLNFPKRYHYSTFLGNGKTLCQIISNFIVTRNCDDKFFTMFNVTGYQIASLGFSHCEIQGFYHAGKFNYFLSNNATVESRMLHQRLT